MEKTRNRFKSRKYSVPINPKLGAYQFFEGYLEKKARNFFAGWQKRYFHCLEGKIIIYTESKESKQIKGYINIKKIAYIKSIDEKSFLFETDNREYLLKAENESLKNKWIETITFLMDYLSKKASKEMNSSFDLNKSADIIDKKEKGKDDKIKKINKKTADLIRKYGYILNKEDTLSDKLIENKGINKLINVNDPKIASRIHYGFMFKKQKNRDIFNKRWFFIFSPRPLYNDDYSKDDYDLEQKKQKDWIKFDVLYYFKYEKNEAEITSYDNKIEMVDCHKIINYEKDGSYYMNLDAGERGYLFFCDTKSERDEWFEVLKNSRKTAKEYKLSITKHPRNIDLINALFVKDIKEFNKKMQEEKNNIVGNINEISEFHILEFTINNFEILIESTLDGCLCSTPNKLDLLKAYAEFMNKEYLNIFKIYWEKNYDKLSNDEILKLSNILFNYYNTINKLNIDDENLLKNGKELTKIYFKKIFQNILRTIENILKNEREFNGNKNEEGLYYTLGPKDLFDILSKTLDLVKEYKHPIIYKELLKIFNVSIFQYLIGVNCIIIKQNIIIGNEYLISVANNSLNIIQFLNSLIENIKQLNVLNESDINEEIQLKKITNSINKISLSAIVRFVYEHKDELGTSFETINFFDIDLDKIFIKTGDIFGQYKSMMNASIIKKCWNEILKLTLCYYISSLLLTARKKKKTKEDIILKIKNDKKILSDSYSGIVGENLAKATLKILDDILDFLEVSQCMISSSCLAMREYIGPAFTYSAAKKCVKLRSDFSKDEKKDCKSQCEDVLNNYHGTKNEDSSYFILLSKKLKKNDKDKVLKKSLKNCKFSDIIEEENKDDISSDSDIEEDKTITAKINECYKESNIEDFLKDFEEENEEDDEKDIYNIKGIEIENSQIFIDDDDDEDEEEEIIDNIDENIQIDYEGYFYKKVFNSYKKYYFQIKNECLYWYADKDRKIAKNKIPLKNINKIESSEENKLLLNINEKDDIKEYKFKFDSEEEKIPWVKKINKNMKKAQNENQIQIKEKIEIKKRKKIISDLFNLKNIKNDGIYIETDIMGSPYRESFFKMTPEIIERLKKDNDKKNKKDNDKKNKKEKKEIKDKEIPKENLKEKEEEKEEEKSKEKGKRKKTIGNKIKDWFKGPKKKKENNEKEEKDVENLLYFNYKNNYI